MTRAEFNEKFGIKDKSVNTEVEQTESVKKPKGKNVPDIPEV